MRAYLLGIMLLVSACKKAPEAAGSGSAWVAVAVAVAVADAGSGSGSGSGSDTGSDRGSGSVAEPVAGPTSDDGFGGITLGLAGQKVVAILGEPTTKDAIEEEGATGLWVASWHWPAKGVDLAMAASAKAQAPTVNSISLTAPSTLKNPKGVGIGSTRDAVLSAYGKAVDRAASKGDEILIGSAYGGVFFDLKDQKVIKIFIGAGAE